MDFKKSPPWTSSIAFNRKLVDTSILTTNGHLWKQQRRFTLMTLRNLGLGKHGLESRIQDEAQCMIESFRAQKGAPFDPFNIISATVGNVISAVVYGHRFSLDDTTYQELIKSNRGLLEGGGSAWAKLYDVFPWLMKHVPGPHQTAFAKMKYLRQFTVKEIQTHKENGLLEEPQDVIDYNLDKIEKSREDAYSTFNENNLISLVTELFPSGTETTATTLQWALLYMVAYPQIQEKVHEELDTVLDGSKLVCYEDRKRLPYTNAVIHEIQRYANIAAVGIPRTCVKEEKVHEELDTVLDGSKLVCYEDRKRLPYTNAVIHEIQRYANIAAVGIPRTCVKEGYSGAGQFGCCSF